MSIAGGHRNGRSTDPAKFWLPRAGEIDSTSLAEWIQLGWYWIISRASESFRY